METASNNLNDKICAESVQAVGDALYVLNGKWKLLILGALLTGPKRYSDIERALGKITPRMLSKELRELEMNELITREVRNIMPPMVIYEMTIYSRSLKPIIEGLRNWGQDHRSRIVASRKAHFQ